MAEFHLLLNPNTEWLRLTESRILAATRRYLLAASLMFIGVSCRSQEEPDSFAESDGGASQAYARQCSLGSAVACLEMGDARRAVLLLEEACKAGAAEECLRLGEMHDAGVKVPGDRVLATIYYHKACDAGSMVGCRRKGSRYLAGDGVPRKPELAFEAFSRACEAGDALSCADLGLMHYRGDGIPEDRQAGIALLETACGLGAEQMCRLLAELSQPSISSSPEEGPPIRFVDATAEAGIAFGHVNGASGDYHVIETMAAGNAFADFDGDGYLDTYMVNGFDLRDMPSELTNVMRREGETYWIRSEAVQRKAATAEPDSYAVYLEPAMGVARPSNAMYRNDGDGTFTDITAWSGTGDTGYGFGTAVADYDSDGDQDLYVTNYGRNSLYRNHGDATFAEVTDAANVAAPQWSTSAAFLDYDNDGSLDLYVANFLDYTPMTNRACGRWFKASEDGLKGVETRSYCGALQYHGVPDVLLHNNGDGTFSDVSVESGVALPSGKGLGVLAWDYDRDGDQDVFVANDAMANFLHRNNGDGTFSEIAVEAGVAYNGDGHFEACMGVDAGDYDSDGDFDLFMTNFSFETNTLYAYKGGVFEDVTKMAGLSEPSWVVLGFGTGFLDYGNDGYLDLYVANGHVIDHASLFYPGVEYEQPHQLLRHNGVAGAARFEDVSTSSGDWFTRKQVSRGTAFGDYDNDGDVDVLIANCGGEARLGRNDGGNNRNWAMFRTVGKQSNRDGVGAEVRLVSGDLSQVRLVRSGSSYLSSSDLRVHFGLGNRAQIDSVAVRWPGGEEQFFYDLPVNEILTLEQK